MGKNVKKGKIAFKYAEPPIFSNETDGDAMESLPSEIQPDSTDFKPLRPPTNAFFSPLITVQLSQSSESVKVHKDILSQLTALHDQIQESFEWNQRVILDVTKPVFDLILCYLYGSPFESILPSLSEHEAQSENPLQLACEVLCFALKYGTDELSDQVMSYIRNTPHVGYQSILEAAKYVYTHASKVEPQFRDYFLQRTQEALVDPSVADETWFVEIFEHGYNGLSMELFRCYKDVCKTFKDNVISTPVSVNPEDGAACEPVEEAPLVEYCMPKECSESALEPMSEPEVPAEPAEPSPTYEVEPVPEEPYSEEIAIAPEVEEPLEEPMAAREPAPWPEPLAAVQTPEEALASSEMVIRHQVSNSCAMRHWHLRKFARWSKCPDCKEEMIGLAHSVRSNGN